jgi:histidinol-phosphate aminotransferase
VAGPDEIATHPNLVVLRTFSKAYGLAGLRCGYALGRGRIIEALRGAMTPFAVSMVAQHAAQVALSLQEEMHARVEAIIKGRDRMAIALRAQGWKVPVTHSNFVWLPAGADSVPLAQAAASAGVLVRPFAGEGLRITAGEEDAINIFLDVAASWV